MSKIIYSTVIYPSKNFELFMHDYLDSVFSQTYINFELLLILDNIDANKVREYVDKFNANNKKVYIKKFIENLMPIELRKKQIEIAYNMKADILIFSDFDENVAINRVEEVIKNISGYAFAFNDFYIVDKNLKKLSEKSFFQTRIIPKEISSYKEILSFNFIGLGSMAINLKQYSFDKLKFPKDIKALDWYIATKVLLSGYKSIALHNTYANYRQHENSFVGFNFKLNKDNLTKGLNVKLIHYSHLKKHNNEFKSLYNEILELKQYIKTIGVEKYIKLVNSKYDTNKFCWWENIKVKKDLV
ncbi:hypothetical protein LXN10_05480 [Arcobacter sp. KX21116]|uniref:glycosyltransferase n=1 Tax=Arcobacter iocasae TaxID=2906515 RepID=UPI0035D4C2BF